jgi:hypothetical protein
MVAVGPGVRQSRAEGAAKLRLAPRNGDKAAPTLLFYPRILAELPWSEPFKFNRERVELQGDG